MLTGSRLGSLGAALEHAPWTGQPVCPVPCEGPQWGTLCPAPSRGPLGAISPWERQKRVRIPHPWAVSITGWGHLPWQNSPGPGQPGPGENTVGPPHFPEQGGSLLCTVLAACPPRRPGMAFRAGWTPAAGSHQPRWGPTCHPAPCPGQTRRGAAWLPLTLGSRGLRTVHGWLLLCIDPCSKEHPCPHRNQGTSP